MFCVHTWHTLQSKGEKQPTMTSAKYKTENNYTGWVLSRICLGGSSGERRDGEGGSLKVWCVGGGGGGGGGKLLPCASPPPTG